MARPEKAAAVKDISDKFSNSEAALLTEYRGLSVGEMAEVRNALREADPDAEYRVSKNTLARIAVRDIGMDELVEFLVGPTAIAYVKGDAAAAAKALDEAAKRFPVLQVKGGVLAGKIISAQQASDLAKLEPRETQLARIAMMMNQPATLTVGALAALLRDLGSMLAQVVTKKESGEPPAAEAATTAEAQPVPQESNETTEANETTDDDAATDGTKETSDRLDDRAKKEE